MKTEEAVRLTVEKFPFKEYMTVGSSIRGTYSDVANTVVRHLRPGSRILDFGSGPCDKTAILQLLLVLTVLRMMTCRMTGTRCLEIRRKWFLLPQKNAALILLWRRELMYYPSRKGFFDMVMLHGVVEHLHVISTWAFK